MTSLFNSFTSMGANDKVSVEPIYNDEHWSVYLLSSNNRKKQMIIHHRHSLNILITTSQESPEHCFCGEQIPKNLVITKALYERT